MTDKKVKKHKIRSPNTNQKSSFNFSTLDTTEVKSISSKIRSSSPDAITPSFRLSHDFSIKSTTESPVTLPQKKPKKRVVKSPEGASSPNAKAGDHKRRPVLSPKPKVLEPLREGVEHVKKKKKKLRSPDGKAKTGSEKLKRHLELVTDDIIKKKKCDNVVGVTASFGEGPAAARYPVLTDEALIRRFQAVSMNNNQKGRIRLALKEVFQGTSPEVLPDVINNRIQIVLNSSKNLTDTDLRKIRILYNMLKVATEAQLEKSSELITQSLSKPKPSEEKRQKDQKDVKKKGEKRYVVFLGNLPVDIDKEKILKHFSDIRNFVKDVRIPTISEEKKSAIAYVELANKSTFEIALSKHHSMMGSKRINVLYTTQKKTKITTAEAKAKTAKLVAMSKSGQLAGGVRRRGLRRAKMRRARDAQEKGDH